MIKAVVVWTNEILHPCAVTYREGFRHCFLIMPSARGWYAREYQPSSPEIIDPGIAGPDDDLFEMLQRNSPRLPRDLIKRKTYAELAVVRYCYQWRWARYRKLPVYHTKHYLGLKAPAIRRPHHLFKLLSPTEQSPRRMKSVEITASLVVPVR